MVRHDDFILALARHLPPSAATLRLLDIGGVAGALLSAERADLSIETASLLLEHWDYAENSFDAVVAYDFLLKPATLTLILRLMRVGGRFILVQPLGKVSETYVQTLESVGYVRILVEEAVKGMGVLIRGEKAHTEASTLARVQTVAERDADSLDLTQYTGRYIHLLIQQSPNKPVWRMRPDDVLTWQAVTMQDGEESKLLAFTSLPKAVRLMQAAVLQGLIRDVNKVGKFTKATALTWTIPILLNPTIEALQGALIQSMPIDPQSAEKSDE